MDMVRRTALGLMTGAIAGVAAPAFAAPEPAGRPDPVVETEQGRVRGRWSKGVMVFKGLRYGADTADANRFMPPTPPPAWSGIRDADAFGPGAPQAPGRLIDGEAVGEDCLRINVWTPGLGHGAKRPVMVWLHGGGFEAGSGGRPLYEGSNLSRRGDVVVATINHRLGVFGHCYLAEALGPEFSRSGNVGFLDLAAALAWVKRNIAAFGGDPGNVTIFGQSGGGRKVSLCYASPATHGLFNRGIVESGAHLRVQTPEQANALTLRLLKAFDLTPARARELQRIPMQSLIDTNTKVLADAGYRFSPMLDGQVFDRQPFADGAPTISAGLPMMIGTARTELSLQLNGMPGIFDIDMAGLEKKLHGYLPDADIPEAIRLFHAAKPDATPPELFFMIVSARSYWLDQTLLAEQRVRRGGAPTYVYRVMWPTTARGGRLFEPHTEEIPFVFDNVQSAGADIVGPPSAATAALTDAFLNTWVAFARGGDPNNKAIPAWAPYDLKAREVMLFDTPPHLASDPQHDERVFMERFPSQQDGVTMVRLG